MSSYGVVHRIHGNMHMSSSLAKQLYLAACATASAEAFIAAGVEVDGIPTVNTEPEAELEDTPAFKKEHEEVEETTDLIRAAAAATSAAEVVEDAEDVQDTIGETVELVDGLNEVQGGVSVENLPMVQLIFDRIAMRCGLESLSLGEGPDYVPVNGKVRIDKSGLEALSEQVNAAMPMFLKSSADKFNQMTSAMLEAVPEVRERLTTLLGDLQMDSRPLDGSVSISEDIRNALSVDGAVPEDLVTYFATYAELGKQLTGEYLRRSGTSAEAMSGLLGSLNYDLPEGFWDTLSDVLEKVGDPRTALGKDSMAISLPGSGKLFNQSEPPQTDGNPTYAKMAAFVLVNEPVVGCDAAPDTDGAQPTLESLDADVADVEGDAAVDEIAAATPDIDPTTADGSPDGPPAPDAAAVVVAEATLDPAAAGPTPDPNAMKSLNRDQLRTIVKSLLDLLNEETVGAAVKQLERNWIATQATVGETLQTVRSVTGEVQQALGPQLEIVPRYAKCVHQLSIWPVANFLTNMIFTSNAVVALGTQMASGERIVEAVQDVKETQAPEAVPAEVPGEPAATAPESATDPALGVSGSDPAADPDDPAAAAVTAVADGSDDGVVADPSPNPADPEASSVDATADLGADVADATEEAAADPENPTEVPEMEPTPAPDPEDPLAQPLVGEDAETTDASADPVADLGDDVPTDPEADPLADLGEPAGDDPAAASADEPNPDAAEDGSTSTDSDEEEEEEGDDNKPTA